MPKYKTTTKDVATLLQIIEDNPDIFLGLEDKKVTPALEAYQAVAILRLCDCLDKLNNTLNNALKVIQQKPKSLYQNGDKEK